MCTKNDAKISKFSKKSVSSKRIVKNQAIEKELNYLRCLLPVVNSNNSSKSNATSKLVVINEAVKYIEELEKQVLLKWSIHQLLINQQSLNERRQIQRLVVNQTKFKKNKLKKIGKK